MGAILGARAGSNAFGRASAGTPGTGGGSTGTAKLTRSGTNLQVGGVTKRLAGLNCYWLGLDDNQGVAGGAYPSKTQIAAAMQGMLEMGANLVRAHTVGMSAGTAKSFETAAGTFVDANLDAADYAVYQAKLKGIYLSCPLTDNWNYYHGGKWNFVHWAYQQNSSGITDTPGTTKDDVNERIFFANTAPGLRVRALFKAYISAWLNHVNPYTGLAYKNDPTIAIVETGNELYYASQLGTDEWTQDIASYIKSIAPDKLVMDGSAADRVYVANAPGKTATAVDILAAHYYPQQQSGSYPPVPYADTTSGYTAGSALAQLAADANNASAAGKPFIVGEYAWTRSDAADLYAAIEGNSKVSGDMPWTFVANTDGGTPLTHGGAFGSDDFSIHRPYANAQELQYAPALARHITAVSGVQWTNGAGAAPAVAANRIATAAIRNATNPALLTASSATLAADTSVSKSGGSSLRVTPTGSGVYPYFYGATPSQWAPVTAGTQYSGFASVRANTSTNLGFQAVLVWYKSDGTYLSSTTGSYAALSQGAWVQASVVGTAPTDAAWATVQLQAGAAMNAADVVYVDEYGVTAGTSVTWSDSGSAADPAAISGLVHRFRASSLSASNGAAVASAAFETGGITLQQATAAAQPTFVTGQLGGKSALRFDGTSDYMDSSATVALAQPFTAVLFLDIKSITGTREFAYSPNGGVDFEINDGSTGYNAYAGQLITMGTPTTGGKVIAWVYNGASTQVLANNSVVVSGNASTNAMGGTLTVGRHPTQGRYAQMDLYEMDIYNRALTSAELQTLLDYYNATYV